MKFGILTLTLLTALSACGSSKNATYPVRTGPQAEHPNGTQAMAQQAATVQQAYVNQPVQGTVADGGAFINTFGLAN